MDLLHPLCAGLDVHKDTVVACLRRVVEGRVKREVRTFGTTTRELLELSDWLASEGCRHVAMEATGVYWKPVWHILGDGDFELVLANARHVKNVPGRKSDVSDAAWLADLLAHGLIRASFVPDGATQELRGLLRTRKQLVRERTSHIQRLQKTLEDANIKLDSTISDVMGRSGRAMIEALIAGETDPGTLAALADGRIKAPQTRLREALRGRVTECHRFLLRLHLRQIDGLSAAIADIDRAHRAAARGASGEPGAARVQAPGRAAPDRSGAVRRRGPGSAARRPAHGALDQRRRHRGAAQGDQRRVHADRRRPLHGVRDHVLEEPAELPRCAAGRIPGLRDQCRGAGLPALACPAAARHHALGRAPLQAVRR